MGVIVSFLQIQLLIGRLIKDRKGELCLLVSIAARPLVVLLVLVCENFIHAAVGWAIGTFGALSVIVSVAAVKNGVMLPTVARLCGISVAALGIAVISVVMASIVSIWGVSMESSLRINRI
jgi:hypothetical protein